MLFELGGRRKRFIQVVYVFLALILGGSLVFFGIGGDAPGGLGDAIGLNPNSGSTGNDVLDQDIESAMNTLENDPENQAALLTLAKAEFLAGQSAAEQDEQGFQVPTEETVTRFEEAIGAWEVFLDVVDGERIRDLEEATTTGTLLLRAYGSVGLSQTRLDRAVETARLVAGEQPNVSIFRDLAVYAYAAGKTKLGDRAAEDALAETTESNRSTIESQLQQAKRQGKLIQQQLEAQAPSGQDFENPLQGLGGGAAPPAQDQP